ncbi:MAG: hypothetical protein ACOYMX_03465 [Burkholderiales bacterium]
MKTYREFLLLTEDGLVLLAEDGQPFGVIVEIDENKQGGTRRRPGWRPSVPLIPRIDLEEEEVLMMCGVL